MKLWGMAVALGLVTLASAVPAQISRNGGPIHPAADNMVLLDAERVQLWTGRVEILQGENRMRADEVKIYHLPGRGDAPAAPNAAPGSSWGEVDRMEAVGNIYFVTPTQTIKGDRAVYTRADDTIVVTGDVMLLQGENVLTGNRLVIEITAGRSSMQATATSGSKGRVKGVFYPGEEKKPGQAPAKTQ
jgi:lipopolysaccharide export system protein LptA